MSNEHDKTAREMLIPIIEMGVDCALYLKVRGALTACVAAAENGNTDAAKLVSAVQTVSRLIQIAGKGDNASSKT